MAVPRSDIVLLSCHRLGIKCLMGMAYNDCLPGTIISTSNQITLKDKVLDNVNYQDFSHIADVLGAGYCQISSNDKLRKTLKSIRPTVIVVAGWFSILPPSIYKIPKKGTILLHGSLLPKYRGGSPVNWQLINGEKKSGITLFYLDKNIDSGDIIAQTTTDIQDSDDVYTLSERLYTLGGKLLRDWLPGVLNGSAPRIPQDHSQATIYRIRMPKDGLIDYKNMTVKQAHNWIRAQTHPYPGAFIEQNNLRIRLWKSIGKVNPNIASNYQGTLAFGEKPPGNIYLKCNDGWLQVSEWEIF